MKVVLKPGEEITIEFHETDGEVTVAFDMGGLQVEVDGKQVWSEEFVPWEDEKCEI
jgi:hypothetical protein